MTMDQPVEHSLATSGRTKRIDDIRDTFPESRRISDLCILSWHETDPRVQPRDVRHSQKSHVRSWP